MVKVADRVKETTTTTGTGDISLAGALSGYRAFSAAFSDTDTFYYCIAGQTSSEWEVGIGTYHTGTNTFTRTTVLASSNTGSAVNFSAGTKDVFCTLAASSFIDSVTSSVDSEVVLYSGTSGKSVKRATGTGIASLSSGVLGTITTSAGVASAISDETGSGSLVFATSPTLVTPTLGVASATSINKVAITAPATASTLTVADGKTLTCSNTLTLTGTDSSSVNFGAGGTVSYGMTSGTMWTYSTGVASVEFTSIPSGVKRITVMANGLGTNGTSPIIIQAGSGSYDTSGYVGAASRNTSSGTGGATSITAGFATIQASVAAETYRIVAVLYLVDASSNLWICRSVGAGTDVTGHTACSSKSFSGTIDRVRVTTVNGLDNFDGGNINIIYE